MKGWSVNISSVNPGHVFEVELPVSPLYVGRLGPVVEIVFWSDRAGCWMHGVRSRIDRVLPEGHVQVTLDDLAWLDRMVAYHGDAGLDEAIRDLSEPMQFEGS